VNREGCRALGIRSVMVTPLLREADVIGVFELLADRTGAFEERDVTALGQISQMVLTALDHADAAKRATGEIVARSENIVRSELSKPDANATSNAAATPTTRQPEATLAQGSSSATARVRGCEVCGFPVSEGRTVCVDCDAERRRADSAEVASSPASDFLAQLNGPVRNQNWFERHMYTIGTVVMVALTILALALKFR
jgi:hypothetical protein